jgi:hypothetical protein
LCPDYSRQPRPTKNWNGEGKTAATKSPKTIGRLEVVYYVRLHTVANYCHGIIVDLN